MSTPRVWGRGVQILLFFRNAFSVSKFHRISINLIHHRKNTVRAFILGSVNGHQASRVEGWKEEDRVDSWIQGRVGIKSKDSEWEISPRKPHIGPGVPWRTAFPRNGGKTNENSAFRSASPVMSRCFWGTMPQNGLSETTRRNLLGGCLSRYGISQNPLPLRSD